MKFFFEFGSSLLVIGYNTIKFGSNCPLQIPKHKLVADPDVLLGLVDRHDDMGFVRPALIDAVRAERIFISFAKMGDNVVMEDAALRALACLD